ncbi:hypothetical protein CEXT_644071 [Caerostris extrusa]|uniref:Uncharacterized protein n=1 Tax=Caerostris extrusa TaxID=172846 RepID=A0AAV4TY73_CAEEX|nr:hypothetical protein CEXT_644071 [Caerostris extrusa]
MEWEETPLEVSQPSTKKVSLPVNKSQQPRCQRRGHPCPPRRTALVLKGKATSFFDSSEEEEVADDHKRRACLRL